MINQALSTPRADDTLDMIGSFKSTVFSKLDAQEGFFPDPYQKGGSTKNSFYSKKYVYEKMPMGLATAPAGFCHLVTLILNN